MQGLPSTAHGIAFVLVLFFIVGLFWRVLYSDSKEQAKKEEAIKRYYEAQARGPVTYTQMTEELLRHKSERPEDWGGFGS